MAHKCVCCGETCDIGVVGAPAHCSQCRDKLIRYSEALEKMGFELHIRPIKGNRNDEQKREEITQKIDVLDINLDINEGQKGQVKD